MTQQDKIKIFQEIVEITYKNPNNEDLGSAIRKTLESKKALQWWDKRVNVTTFNKKELEVIHAVQNEWQFYNSFGTYYYWHNNTPDGLGPITGDKGWNSYDEDDEEVTYESVAGKNLRVVSKRMIKKLKLCGKFPKDYKFK
jgi:hypothetical protein